jgi:tRNA modification GTPase
MRNDNEPSSCGKGVSYGDGVSYGAGVSYGDEAPIAAFATTPGKSALTLIRCSGKGTLELAASVFSNPEKLLNATGNTVIHGWIVRENGNRGSGNAVFRANQQSIAGAEKVDEVLISVFRAPKSYTGEDGLDISCHGGIAAGRGIMDTLRAAGFRDALPGEFTFRAFMNGKLDLTRSESVMELVSARTDRGRHNAVNRLSGILENEINFIKKNLVEVLSGAEIFLDYSEDEIGVSVEEAAGQLPKRQLAAETLIRLRKLAESWQREKIYQEGILAVIAGRPNAGKSSLFNLLLKEERSIVTEIPGTTRDWIEAWVSIEDIPVRLADTAGLRDSKGDQESLDPVERIGVERSRSLLEAADIVLYLIDGTVGITSEDLNYVTEYGQAAATQHKPLLLLWNKSDIAPAPAKTAIEINVKNIIAISAKTGAGIKELSQTIVAAVGEQIGESGDNDLQATAGSLRQKKLLETAAAALEDALNLAEQEEPLDLIAPRLREAVNALGEITGEVSTADILEEMFSRFCVGK